MSEPPQDPRTQTLADLISRLWRDGQKAARSRRWPGETARATSERTPTPLVSDLRGYLDGQPSGTASHEL